MYQSLQQSGAATLNFLYGAGSQPQGVKHLSDGYVYYYMYNAQGDVIGLYDSYGRLQCRYTYDTWGAVVAITDAEGNAITDQSDIAHQNPFRYRGYYYDTETGLYYLQSRYYNPEWCRFLNADVLFIAGEELIGSNMYAYCGNNPVMGYDPSGMWSLTEDDDNLFRWHVLALVGAIYLYNAGITVARLEVLMANQVFNKAEDILYFALLNSGPYEVAADGGVKPKLGTPPPPSSGYTPHKKKGAYQGKDKNGNKGWVDEHGNVWVPDPSGHAGPHWDVQGKKGYINVGPNGNTWGGKGTVPGLYTPISSGGGIDWEINWNVVGGSTLLGLGFLLFFSSWGGDTAYA